jgi:DNA-directed RNA polymerase specialized sigma24 family protein
MQPPTPPPDPERFAGMSDTELIAYLAGGGDGGAALEALRRWDPLVLRFSLAAARHNRLPDDVADDIAQAVRWRLARVLGHRRLRAGATMETWTAFVRRTTARCAADACRRTFGWRGHHRTTGNAGRRLRDATNEDRLVPHARHPWCGLDDPAEAAVASEELARLEAVIVRLDAQEWVAWQVLRNLLTHEEGAERCGIHPGTMHHRCQELRHKLLTELSEQPHPAPPAKGRRRAQ